ncbi:MAG: hypothetical protein ACTHON_17800 [Humibacter sp.]
MRSDATSESPLTWLAKAIDELLPAHLAILEAELSRLEDASTRRQTSAGTRSNLLIGASAVLGGTALIVVPGVTWLSSLSLALYLAAALIGLWSFRSRMGREPNLPVLITEYSSFKSVSMRRALLLSRLEAHEVAVSQLNSRHRWIVTGFLVLALAFVSSGVATAVNAVNPPAHSPTEIRIVK